MRKRKIMQTKNQNATTHTNFKKPYSKVQNGNAFSGIQIKITCPFLNVETRTYTTRVHVRGAYIRRVKT